MRKSLIGSNSTVVDVVMAGEDWSPPDGLAIGPDGGDIGDVWTGTAYLKPSSLPPEEAPAPTQAPSQETAPPQAPAPAVAPPSLRVTFAGTVFDVPDATRLTLSVGLANAAIVAGVQAGDLRWHGGPEDFTWLAADGTAVPMDAPTVIAFARAALAAT